MSGVFKNTLVPKEEKYLNSDLEFRLQSIQSLLKRSQVEGLLVINGTDGLRNEENTKLTNFLFRGFSGHSIFRNTEFDMDFEESMMMITPTCLSLFIEAKAFNKIRTVVLSLHDPNIFVPQGDILENQDLLENLKIREFYRMVYDKPTIGVLLPNADQSVKVQVESWPIVRAYGIDGKCGSRRRRGRVLDFEA